MNEQHIYIISVLTENTIRVLQKMAGIFARHRINIEQLNVFETGNKGTSCFNIVVHSDTKTMTRLMHQLERIIELKSVEITNQLPLSPQ